MLFNGYKISVLQDEEVLEICCETLSLQLIILYCTLKILWGKMRVDLMLTVLTTIKTPPPNNLKCIMEPINLFQQ